MATRRGRSMDREGDRLAEVLERLANRPMMQAPPQFKAPQHIEYFISRFEEVAETNGWRPTATLLHLRDSLRDSAEDCGRAATVQAVYAALRARFGLTPREARSRRSILKKDYRTSLQEQCGRGGETRQYCIRRVTTRVSSWNAFRHILQHTRVFTPTEASVSHAYSYVSRRSKSRK